MPSIDQTRMFNIILSEYTLNSFWKAMTWESVIYFASLYEKHFNKTLRTVDLMNWIPNIYDKYGDYPICDIDMEFKYSNITTRQGGIKGYMNWYTEIILCVGEANHDETILRLEYDGLTWDAELSCEDGKVKGEVLNIDLGNMTLY